MVRSIAIDIFLGNCADLPPPNCLIILDKTSRQLQSSGINLQRTRLSTLFDRLFGQFNQAIEILLLKFVATAIEVKVVIDRDRIYSRLQLVHLPDRDDDRVLG
jgi:ABC-type cobalamin transport system ATPase subunit